MTKCCELWVVKFFSVSPSVMYGTVMKWLGQAVYSCTADMCTVQLPVYSVQPGNFHPHLSGQSGAGERAGRRAEPCSVRGPATRLSETNQLQLKFFVLRHMQVNEDLKFWIYLKQIMYHIPQLMRQMQVNKDLKFWNNEETVKAEVWKDYLKQITRYSHSYANTHSLTW